MAKLRQKPVDYLQRENYITRRETVEQLCHAWHFQPAEEDVPLTQAVGRTIAEDIYSQNTLPVCRAAAADGVAVRFSDFAEGPPDYSNWVEGVDYATADMGDDFADAFDTVMWIEDYTFDEQGKIVSIDLTDPVTKGMLVREQGSTLAEGELVFSRGSLITPFKLGVLAAAGIERLPVIKKPLIAFIPTGTELIPTGTKPSRGQNIETNSLMVKAFGSNLGADVITLPIISDSVEVLENALDHALSEADIVLMNGGTSMGSEDYTSLLLKEKASHYQHGVRCIPGIPIAVSVIEGRPVVNLPGPPFAAFCALDWCVRALIAHWYGRKPWLRPTAPAILESPIEKPAVYEMIVRLQLTEEGKDRLVARPIGHEERYAEAAAAWNGLFVAPIGRSRWEAGEVINAELLMQADAPIW